MSDLASLYRCSGDYRIVYECTMAYDHRIYGDQDAYGESKFIRTERRQRTWHVAATSQKLAEAAWHKENGYKGGNNELISCLPICVLDREISIS